GHRAPETLIAERTRLATGTPRAYPPYLYRPATASVRLRGLRVVAGLFWGVPESALCALVVAGFCERSGGSRTGRGPGRCSRRRGRRWRGRRGADQAGRGGRGVRGGRGGGFSGWGGWPFCPGGQPRRPGAGRKAASLTWVRGARGAAPATRVLSGVPACG